MKLGLEVAQLYTAILPWLKIPYYWSKGLVDNAPKEIVDSYNKYVTIMAEEEKEKEAAKKRRKL